MTTERRRIEAQGFLGLSDGEINEIKYWLRSSPALCLAWVAAGVASMSPTILLALLPFALAGAVFRGHPFDVIYNHGIRCVTGTIPLPPYGKPRRFACMMASVMIILSATALYFQMIAIGVAIGIVMIIMAAVQVTTGFCVPSFCYGVLFGKRSGSRPEELSVQND